MKLFYILALASTLATGHEELCLICKCSTVNIIARDELFRSGIFDGIEDWSPLLAVPDPSGRFLNVNCSRARIPKEWPPVSVRGISAHFEDGGLVKFPDLEEAIKMKIFKLSLAGNGIAEITRTETRDLKQLRMFDLSRNRIREVSEDSFTDLKQLSYLDLSRNEISRVGKWSTDSNLIYLNLRSNRVSVIMPESLNGLRNLIYLDLSGNNLNRLSDNFGSSLSKLKYLHLEENKFEGVPRLPRSLSSVNMRSNVMSSSVLPQIDDLFVLDVSNNRLDDLDNIYDQLALKILRAGHNNLSSIGEWKGTELRILDLGYNNLTKIPDGINSEKLPQLEELYLDGNPINEIKFNPGTKPFKNLEILSLSNLGDLKTISRECFYGALLESNINCSEEKGLLLNLAKNKLRNVDEDTFRGFPICSVDLSYNNFIQIPEDLFEWKDISSADLQGNPWNCICDSQWMLDDYLPRFYGIKPHLLFELRCATPSRFKDRMLVYWYNSSNDVFCKTPSYFQYEYAEGKYFEMWTASMIASIVLLVIILIVIIAIIVLLILRSRKTKNYKNKSKRKSKPIFRELRINPDHKYNEISQDGSV